MLQGQPNLIVVKPVNPNAIAGEIMPSPLVIQGFQRGLTDIQRFAVEEGVPFEFGLGIRMNPKGGLDLERVAISANGAESLGTLRANRISIQIQSDQS